ncbi:SAM-dependent chlorinase/fluorinase [soil metagenome]
MGPRVTLLTDFGTADGYAAAMKGVIVARAPGLLIDDASHEIPPGDVRAAAWALDGYWRAYPPQTVHVVVVDPGVGSDRRPLCCEAEDRYFVGPDNGVFSRVLRAVPAAQVLAIDVVSLTDRAVSATFHGRDIFAPAAAHIAVTGTIEGLGRRITDPLMLADAEPLKRAEGAIGAVIHVDRFGSLITNIPGHWLPAGSRARIGTTVVPLLTTYADALPGQLLAIIGSRGVLEIAVRDGSAAERLGAGPGVIVEIGG